MILSELKIHSLRNITSAHFSLNPRFNFIIGPNGSGKTSILEALYLLSCGHSFRSREISPMITHDQSMLTVFARSVEMDTVSIQKSSSNITQIKINSQFCTSTSQLAYALPCQVFYSEIFQIIDCGPSVRRSVLDWGLFHVKHEYLNVWKQYKKVLKQRNALLKKHAPFSHFVPWNIQLSDLAHQLDAFRQEYFSEWQEAFKLVLHQLTDCSCTINYYKGWDKKQTGKNLNQILEEHFESDSQKQYTQHGAHQADIYIESNDFKAKNVLSRGQQKIILIALKLSQGLLLNNHCLYLFDDLAAELDELHQQKLFKYLIDHEGQYVITSINSLQSSIQVPADQSAFVYIHNGSLKFKKP
jgi:DNA replication and repair protein RecF